METTKTFCRMGLVLFTSFFGLPSAGLFSQALFDEQIILEEFQGATCIATADFNADGYVDFTATSNDGHKVSWFENDGTQQFTEHPIITGFTKAKGVTVANIDNNSSWDIVATAKTLGRFSWFENDGTGNFAERLLSEDAYDMIQVHVEDLDQDGDPDILGACYGSHEIRWWESINAFLVPGFRATPETGQLPLEVNFTDETYAKPHVYSWKWDFDNDGTVDSQEQHPQWNYTASGKYTVTLVVENDAVTDTITRENLVRVFNGESSFEFNGSNTRVQCLSEEPLNLTGNFTIEAWIKPMGFGVSGSGRILDKMMLSVYANGHSADLPNDTSLAVMMIHKDGTVSLFSTGAHTLMPGEWQHVAFSYDSISSEAHLYIDGLDQAIVYETAPSGPLMQNGTRDLYLGNARVGELGMDGSLDEVRLWDHLRTAGDINEWMEFNLPANQAGLYGYWKMNEGEGDTTFDRSGNHRDALRLTALWDLGVELLNVALPEPAKPKGATVSCFPNPANGQVTVDLTNAGCTMDEQVILRCVDFQGREVWTQVVYAGTRMPEINTADWSPGLYFISVYQRNTLLTGAKLMVE